MMQGALPARWHLYGTSHGRRATWVLFAGFSQQIECGVWPSTSNSATISESSIPPRTASSGRYPMSSEPPSSSSLPICSNPSIFLQASDCSYPLNLSYFPVHWCCKFFQRGNSFCVPSSRFSKFHPLFWAVSSQFLRKGIAQYSVVLTSIRATSTGRSVEGGRSWNGNGSWPWAWWLLPSICTSWGSDSIARNLLSGS